MYSKRLKVFTPLSPWALRDRPLTKIACLHSIYRWYAFFTNAYQFLSTNIDLFQAVSGVGLVRNIMFPLPRHLLNPSFIDVVKAVCLGATAVGLGRPFLYAQSVSTHVRMDTNLLKWILCQAYGVAGVSKIIDILRREIVTAMRLLGASKVEDLRPEMVCIFKQNFSYVWTQL